MLTYTLSSDDSRPLYEQLCGFLRRDILSGRLPSGARLPSKRSLSGNLGVSSITVESAYNRLIDEGYVRSEPKRMMLLWTSPETARPPHAFHSRSGPI